MQSTDTELLMNGGILTSHTSTAFTHWDGMFWREFVCFNLYRCIEQDVEMVPVYNKRL